MAFSAQVYSVALTIKSGLSHSSLQQFSNLTATNRMQSKPIILLISVLFFSYVSAQTVDNLAPDCMQFYSDLAPAAFELPEQTMEKIEQSRDSLLRECPMMEGYLQRIEIYALDQLGRDELAAVKAKRAHDFALQNEQHSLASETAMELFLRFENREPELANTYMATALEQVELSQDTLMAIQIKNLQADTYGISGQPEKALEVLGDYEDFLRKEQQGPLLLQSVSLEETYRAIASDSIDETAALERMGEISVLDYVSIADATYYRWATMISLGEELQKRGKHKRALALFQQAIPISSAVDYENMEEMYRLSIVSAQALGDTQLELSLQQDRSEMNKQYIAENLETKDVVAEIDKLNQEYNADRSRGSDWSIVLGIIPVVLIMGLLAMWALSRKRIKDLAESRNEIESRLRDSNHRVALLDEQLRSYKQTLSDMKFPIVPLSQIDSGSDAEAEGRLAQNEESHFMQFAAAFQDKYGGLNDKDLQVAYLSYRDLTATQIAEAMSVTKRSIEARIYRIRKQIGSMSKAETLGGFLVNSMEL